MAIQTPGTDKQRHSDGLIQPQRDNLLDLLNGVETEEELIRILHAEDRQDLVEAAGALLARREELGAFLEVEDFTALYPATSDVARTLFEAARRPLLARPRFSEGISLSALFSSAPFVLAYPASILFDIEWVKFPREWLRLFKFTIALCTKRLGLSQRLEAIEGRIAELDERLDQLEGTQPTDPVAINLVKGQLETAREQKGDVEREAGELNRLVKKKDKKGLFKIVKRNLQAKIQSLEAQLAQAIHATPPKPKRIQQLQDELDAERETLAKIETEVSD